MPASKDENMRVGEFLIENGIITKEQLNDALDLQRFNKDRLVGEILVTQGVLSKEDLIMALELYLMATDAQLSRVDEWLDQEEVDLIIERLGNR
jgi:type IV pilus assembly protein PilB